MVKEKIITAHEQTPADWELDQAIADAAYQVDSDGKSVDDLNASSDTDLSHEIQIAKDQLIIARQELLDAITQRSIAAGHSVADTARLFEQYGFDVQMEKEVVYQGIIEQYALGKQVQYSATGSTATHHGYVSDEPRLILAGIRPSDEAVIEPFMLVGINVDDIEDHEMFPFRTNLNDQVSLSERIRLIN